MLTDLVAGLLHALRDPYLVFYAISPSGYGLLMLAEAGYGLARGQRLYHPRETAANLVVYAGFFTINFLWSILVFEAYRWAYAHRVLDWGYGGWHVGLESWWIFGLLIVADDFVFYWFHRSLHSSRLLWASHVPHHSSEHFNLSAAFRQTWAPFFALPFWIVLPWLGFDPLMVGGMQVASLFWQVGLHTRVIPKLGPLEWIFNTPSHHRVHHGANALYRDKNLGGIFIVWDRLFGTFVEESEPVRYGIGRPVGHNPLKITLGEFAAWARDVLRAPGQALRLTFGRP